MSSMIAGFVHERWPKNLSKINSALLQLNHMGKYIVAALISIVILSACATQMSDEELRSLIQSEVLLAIEELKPQLVGSEGPQGPAGERGIQGEPGLRGEV